MATALSLPQVLATVTPVRLAGGDADRPLAIKVAVAAGSTSRLLVGSPDVHTFEALGGSFLSRTTDLEQVAQPGDMVTDAGTMALWAMPVPPSRWLTVGQPCPGRPSS